MGMSLGLGVIVTDVSDGGLAGRCGLRNGDQLFQVGSGPNDFSVLKKQAIPLFTKFRADYEYIYFKLLRCKTGQLRQ